MSRARGCFVADCERPVLARSLCSAHYARDRKRGDLGTTPIRVRHVLPPHCLVDGCGRGCYALGLCSKHYKKFKKYGDPTKVKRPRKAT